MSCGKTTLQLPSEVDAQISWNKENPAPEPNSTCCQRGCSDAPKATPSTPVWNVHLKDGRVAKVVAHHCSSDSHSVIFLNNLEEDVAEFWPKDIDFIARDGAVEIVPADPKSAPDVQPGGGECFENFCARNKVQPDMTFAYHAWIAERKKSAPNQDTLPTVEDVQKIYQEEKTVPPRRT
jgi:hypothetical protein